MTDRINKMTDRMTDRMYTLLTSTCVIIQEFSRTPTAEWAW